jgi:hypothetical protein
MHKILLDGDTFIQALRWVLAQLYFQTFLLRFILADNPFIQVFVPLVQGTFIPVLRAYCQRFLGSSLAGGIPV